MKVWAVDVPSPADRSPMRQLDRAIADPGSGQALIKVSTCGVCRTDLHLAEGDLRPKRHLVVPGHEVVGRVEALGSSCTRLSVGDRVGVPWLARTCSSCRFCLSGRENLCLNPTFTGWDVDGGFAESLVADERYVYDLPGGFDDEKAAPLLCAGIIGYRALKLASVPPSGSLGIYGFGGSAHIAAQIAIAEGARVHVFTRSPEARALALSLGAQSAGDSFDKSTEPLDSAILFAPVGNIVPHAMESLDMGGTLAVAGISLSDIPPMDYQRHLFQEKILRSVTANTRQDGREFLRKAAEYKLSISTIAYGFDQADKALADLAADRVTGAAVLVMGA